MPETKLDQYRAEIIEDISACLQEKGCQPILFIGSGVSRRHFAGPSWDELLSHLAKNCPLIDKEYTYYKQSLGNPLRIGAEFAKKYQEWAWGAGHNNFPKELFAESVRADAYIKYAIAEHLKTLTPKSAKSTSSELTKELAVISAIKPHAIITTNYDQFLETVFPDYTPIVGQQIIKGAIVAVGEIFKIHGCVSDFQSLVFTEEDYSTFTRRKKYLIGKLMTFFCEHPLLFVGYSANDPNIRAILSDIDEALTVDGGVIPNVYIVEWRPNMPANPAKEKLIEIEGGKSIRIKAIETDDFGWVFRAFGSQQPLNNISPKILRALVNRSYELARHDIPRKVVEADFTMLEHAVETQDGLAKLFGLTTISEPSQVAANFPYTLTQLSKKLGEKGKSWQRAHKAIQKVKADKGVDLKKSDNPYHCGINYGTGGPIHKYSEEAFLLLKRVLAGEKYDLSMSKPKPVAKAPPPPAPRPMA